MWKEASCCSETTSFLRRCTWRAVSYFQTRWYEYTAVPDYYRSYHSGTSLFPDGGRIHTSLFLFTFSSMDYPSVWLFLTKFKKLCFFCIFLLFAHYLCPQIFEVRLQKWQGFIKPPNWVVGETMPRNPTEMKKTYRNRQCGKGRQVRRKNKSTGLRSSHVHVVVFSMSFSESEISPLTESHILT